MDNIVHICNGHHYLQRKFHGIKKHDINMGKKCEIKSTVLLVIDHILYSAKMAIVQKGTFTLVCCNEFTHLPSTEVKESANPVGRAGMLPLLS